MKDNFSTQSDQYAKYRPAYPPALFEYLNAIVRGKQNAWDCGTGNGQVACELAKTFGSVFATDISRSQISNAFKKDNISYSVQPAEKTSFDDCFFDLIIVAQAIHWFDFEEFYKEVKRTARENALLCVVGYGKLEISEQIDKVIADLYGNILGRYWDKERQYIDKNYKTIPFPFNEIPSPDLVNTQYWTLDHLTGYLNTWSAVKHFVKQNNYNPINEVRSEIKRFWGNEPTRPMRFPLLLRTGRITNENE
ncbi:MAG TPA: class I SAM-dependent methyltransferase [Edaphocola sp.]|nr:class I SAM-dependent methyltransferase [Edaphocola sp.]